MFVDGLSGVGAFACVVGQAFDAMTKEQRHAVALGDLDAQLLPEADKDRMTPTPRLKIIRRVLGLTQEGFAARYQIPLGTLRDWEKDAKKPDQAARARRRSGWCATRIARTRPPAAMIGAM
jgi:DNA-binding transcriptional regulator YiaG